MLKDGLGILRRMALYGLLAVLICVYREAVDPAWLLFMLKVWAVFEVLDMLCPTPKRRPVQSFSAARAAQALQD